MCLVKEEVVDSRRENGRMAQICAIRRLWLVIVPEVT
jgi:hypothetical protein